MYHKPACWSMTALKNCYLKQAECPLDLNHAQIRLIFEKGQRRGVRKQSQGPSLIPYVAFCGTLSSMRQDQKMAASQGYLKWGLCPQTPGIFIEGIHQKGDISILPGR